MNTFVTIWAIIAVLFLVMLVGRHLVCWYWKINSIEKLLISIEKNTRRRSDSAYDV